MALDITLRQLRYFQAVAEYGTYTRAAEVLPVSQPTISAAVKDLERRVGLPLLEPLHRRAHITQAGRVVLRTTERILRLLHEAEEQLTEFTGGHTGHVTLGASSTPGTDLAGEAWVMREAGSSTRACVEAGLGAREFSPRILMELSNTEAIKKAVAAGLGVAIVTAHAIETERHAGLLVTRPLADLELTRGIYLIHRCTFRPTPSHDAFAGELMRTAGLNKGSALSTPAHPSGSS